MSLFERVKEEWLAELNRKRSALAQDDPNYYDPQDLVTTSTVHSFTIGTGEQLLKSLFPAIAAAQSEVLFVTCFWADSTSLSAFSECLSQLFERSEREGRKVRVRIGFSSRSISQKLFQTSSLVGKPYPPSTWPSLGLPTSLPGLDLGMKSIFVRPFSVMHTKFVVIDRKRVFVPSCNVSWENWFEGVVELTGPIVSRYIDFWEYFWGRDEVNDDTRTQDTDQESALSRETVQKAQPLTHIPFHHLETPTLLLISPHHQNPNFRPFGKAPPPPSTPLNEFLFAALGLAKRSVYLQTPTLTSPPVIDAVLRTIRRGVDVYILTNTKMMTIEQVVTAGTWTERCVAKLQRRYRKEKDRFERSPISNAEQGLVAPGQLTIDTYSPDLSRRSPSEPVKSHLKLSIIDEEIVVLGSGNMDRASWYTSQEIGVAFASTEMAREIRRAVQDLLSSRRHHHVS